MSRAKDWDESIHKREKIIMARDDDPEFATNDSGDQEEILTWEQKTTRVFMQLNTLWGTLIARLMVMFMNETIMKPWIGSNEAEMWCAPNHKMFMRILGLKPTSNSDSRKYYQAIDTLNENGFAAKQITKLNGKPHLFLAVNFERIDELLQLPRYTSSIPAVLMNEKKYLDALENYHKQLEAQTNDSGDKEADNDGSSN